MLLSSTGISCEHENKKLPYFRGVIRNFKWLPVYLLKKIGIGWTRQWMDTFRNSTCIKNLHSLDFSVPLNCLLIGQFTLYNIIFIDIFFITFCYRCSFKVDEFEIFLTTVDKHPFDPCTVRIMKCASLCLITKHESEVNSEFSRPMENELITERNIHETLLRVQLECILVAVDQPLLLLHSSHSQRRQIKVSHDESIN